VNNANAGTTVTGTVLGTPRAATVSSINFSLTNAAEDSMLVTYSNYGGSKVFLGTTLNGTPAFRDITGNLPDMPVRWGMFDPRSSNMVILATELGVWSCDDISVATPQWNTTNNILANTRVDMLKYRASDRTILAVTHGRGMFTTIVPPNLNPEINFAAGAVNTAAEKTTTTIGCRNFTDYDVQVNINGAPSANADITLSHTGTATEGVDFDYTTNNVFGAGNSKVLSFANASADSKSFKVRVYDDAIVDPNETVVFSFTVNNNGGNGVVGVTAPTQTFTISDNDVAINTGTASTVANDVGGAADPAVNVFSPFNGSTKKARYQSIYTAAELTAAGLSAGSNITALGFKIKFKQTAAGFIYNGFNVKIAPTTRTSANNQFEPDATFTTCYTGNITPGAAEADINIAFTTNFVWNGTSNIAVQYCWDNGSTTDPSSDIVYGTDLGAGQRGSIFVSSNNDSDVGCNLPTNSFSLNTQRATIKLTHYKPATLVETNVNAQIIENVQQNAVEYNFYSSANNLITSLKNVNASLGCVTAKVLTAGNGFTPFLGQASTNRSNKIWSITPTTNAATTTYTVTLYMTTAELAGQSATGMKIYKSSAANIASANVGNTITAPTVVTTSADGSWTSFTATFTGFSIFFIGSTNIVLPISSLNINGNLNAQKQAIINWQVQENNIANYHVEKSTDGIIFNKVATFASKGNGTNNYSFIDVQALNNAVYYRVKQVDLNGVYSYSSIIKLSNYQIGSLSIYPNPVKDMVIISGATIGGKAILTDISGKILQQITITQSTFSMDLSKYNSGVYILKTDNGITHKIVL
jgi:trimeric autotransporter adhesin